MLSRFRRARCTNVEAKLPFNHKLQKLLDCADEHCVRLQIKTPVSGKSFKLVVSLVNASQIFASNFVACVPSNHARCVREC